MWYTLVNECTPYRLKEYLDNSNKATKKVIGSVVKKNVTEFEASQENLTRSVKVLYSGGLLSKRKYKAVRLNLSMESNAKSKGRKSYKLCEDLKIPKLLTYTKLIKYITSVNVGNVKQLSELCDVDEKVNGAYRELDDFLPILAELYIEFDKVLGSNSYLMNFGYDYYKFLVAIGADGAPFGKHDEATAWLVSFLNSGDRITSQNENFLLAGANCAEDHICMKRYCRKLLSDIHIIESKEYFVNEHKVTFSFEMVPSDMKWLASFSGELSNASFYFSSFANVNRDNKRTINGTLGILPENSWQPWEYERRLRVVELVSGTKQALSLKKLSDATKRNKILDKIRDLGSRQEFKPVLGKLVDKAYAEPLHNSNNAWQYMHGKLLEEAVVKSNIPLSCIDIFVLPRDSPIRKFLHSLKHDVKATRLYKKVLTWFKGGRSKKFDYRFTGKDARLLSHNFMYLIHSLAMPNESEKNQLRLVTLSFCCLKLRDAVSLFSRIIVADASVITELKKCCLQFFNVVSLMLANVTPTVWTVGYAIPRHFEMIHEKYGVGLGINSMQGREAKHVCLQQYARHSNLSQRWNNVLKHDFISSVWLRKLDPFHFVYNKCKDAYVPHIIHQSCFCYCGFGKADTEVECIYCSSAMFKAIEVLATDGKLSPKISSILEL